MILMVKTPKQVPPNCWKPSLEDTPRKAFGAHPEADVKARGHLETSALLDHSFILASLWDTVMIGGLQRLSKLGSGVP